MDAGKIVFANNKGEMKQRDSRKRAPRYRHHVITTFNTKVYKLWKKLDIADKQIRYISYQLEMTAAGRLHVQAYVEFYDAVRLTQCKERLGDNSLHSEQRKGPRTAAKDYTQKDGSAYFQVNYPEWSTHGGRVIGTDVVQMGTFRTKQGQRTDLAQVEDLIKDGASELDIFETCAPQYLKYANNIRKARGLMARKRCNQWMPIDVHVVWGDTRSGKTRSVYDRHGPDNVYIPTYSESANKFWFDGYDGQKVLLINEFYGQCRTSIMQELLDNYRIQVETKGGTTVSNWDTIYITSNCHPKEWYSHWASVPQKVEDSFIERIKTITHLLRSKSSSRKTWEDIPELGQSGGPSITPRTSVPRTPRAILPSTCPANGAFTLEKTWKKQRKVEAAENRSGNDRENRSTGCEH